MAPDNDSLEYIDEFFYEFHPMTAHEKAKLKNTQNVILMYETMEDWYDFFGAVKQKGVRAHAWI